ncbi:MAG: YegS/Rv2252/BmrU family lipid kinase [Bacilli bacterium]|nr:YegS/Rv2252/BmrU family lipid kinase [Bacilli bacterium]
MKKCVVIYNPESGYKKNKINLELVESILNTSEYNVIFLKTTKKGDAKNYMLNLEYVDLVIAAGGDGTLNEVISGNIEREEPLLISHLPIGTVTDVGKLYGFTKNTMKDLSLMMNGEIKNIDVGLINDIPFLYVACFGNYTNISYQTPRRLKKMFGRFGYILFAIKSIGKRIKRYHIKYEVDGQIYEGEYSFIFITNSSRVAGLNNIYHDVKLDDNKFEVALCDVRSKRNLLKTFYQIRTKDIKDIPNISYYQTDNLKIIFDKIPESSWCIDGEELAHESKTFTFEIDRSSQVLLPKKNVKKLFKRKI